MPRGCSLHIGLNSVDANKYEGWDGQLTACENDARDMQRITKELSYTTQLLLTKEATRESVLDAITTTTEQLEKDDIFVLTYAGHGGQVRDTNGDEKDGKDETWVLYDGEVVDDELHQLYTRFKAGVRVFVLSDSCHSGTVTRALYESISPLEAGEGLRPHATFRSKRLPRDIERAVNEKYSKEFDQIQQQTKAAVSKSPAATIILISGCQDNQLSSDGDVNGLFTENLLKVWNNGKYTNDYRHFQGAINKRMPPSQQPIYFQVGASNKEFERQRPFTIIVAEAAVR